MIVKECLWVLEVAFQCWLEHSSVFVALSWPLLMVHRRLLVTDISTMAHFGLRPKSLSLPFSTIYSSHLNSIFSPRNRTMIAFSSVTQSCPTLCDPWTSAHQASLSITNFQSLLKLMSIKLVMTSNHLILCHPLLFPPSVFSNLKVLSSESVLRIRWPKYWSFSISPSNEYTGLKTCRMDLLDLLAVQGTLKSLLQHRNSKASILWHSAFLVVQVSYPYMTTGNTIALSRSTFGSKVMFLLFHMLSWLVIALLPRSKCLNFMATATICSDFWSPRK